MNENATFLPLTVDMPLEQYMETLSTINTIPEMINHMGNFDAHRTYPKSSSLNRFIRYENFIPSDIDGKLMLSGHLSSVVDNDKVPEYLLKWINGAKRYTELLRSEFETLFIQSQTELNKRIAFIERHVARNEQEARREPGSLSNCVLQLPDELIRLIGSYVYMPYVRLSVLHSTQSVLLEQIGNMSVTRYVELMKSIKTIINDFIPLGAQYTLNLPDLFLLKTVQYNKKPLPYYIRSLVYRGKNSIIQNKKTRVQYIKDVFDAYQYVISAAQSMKLKNLENISIDRLLHMYHTVMYCSQPKFNVRKKPV